MVALSFFGLLESFDLVSLLVLYLTVVLEVSEVCTLVAKVFAIRRFVSLVDFSWVASYMCLF